MNEKLATIQRIHSITSHPNSEVTKIECAKVLEWPVIIKRGEFKENDLVVFIVIDSILPETEYFEFMRARKFRVWNARFKGQPSSGLVCPLSILPKDRVDAEGIDLYVGSDMTSILNIIKYERPIDLQVNGDAIGGFPTNLISISDEDNLLSYPESLQELIGKRIYITQKVDGSSTSFTYNNGEFKACSRRLEMKEGSGFPWLIANKYNIKDKLQKLGLNIAIQGETIGPKINGNRLELKDIELRVFRAKNLDTNQLFNLEELSKLCLTLDIPMVKMIAEFDFNPEIHNIEYFRNLADSQLYDNGKPAEGIVVAPIESFYSSVLNKHWSIKLINQNYKQD
ncbi:MAG: RNA ligase family protein [bacterium]|nr:RNA ligase family protein [bacterium]